jgi:hypothetical protein
VQLCDGSIDPGSQPEIVGIDDETAHGLSLSTLGLGAIGLGVLLIGEALLTGLLAH